MTRQPKIGEVFIVDLGLVRKVRPVVVMSREDPQAPRAVAIAVPLSLDDTASRYEVRMPRVPWLKSQGVANVQGVFGVQFHELTNYRGRFERSVVIQIQKALLWALDLENLARHLSAT